MGFFKKIFKSIGKVFKKIGKGIKKAFVAVGKFTSKLGIVGQIGMMFAVPYLAGLAVKGLTTLGSGFMTGLAKTGYITSGTKLVAAKGFTAGAARVAHTVLSTAAEIASKGMHTYRTISNTIKGVVGDIAKGIGNKMGIPTNISFVSPMTGKAVPGVEGTAGDIFENAVKRLKHGFNPPPLTDRILPLTDVNPKSMNYEYGGGTQDVTSKIAPSDPSMNRPVYAPVEGATPDGNLIDIIFPADKTEKEVAEIAARKAAAAKAAAEDKSLVTQGAEALFETGAYELMAAPPTEYTYAGGPGPSSRSYVPPRNPDNTAAYGIAGIAEFTAAHGIGIPFGTTRADDYASLAPASALIADFDDGSYTNKIYDEYVSGKPPLWFPEPLV